MRRAALLASALVFLTGPVADSAEAANANEPDVSRWALSHYPEEFFKGRSACDEEALNFWMQSMSYRGDPRHSPPKRTQFERLLSGDAKEVAAANREISRDCARALRHIGSIRKTGAFNLAIWITVALRAREKLTAGTLRAIGAVLRQADLSSTGSNLIGWIEIPGSNGANIHGHLTPLALGPELVRDVRARFAASWGLRRELDHMNSTGDIAEFNVLESHWNGAASWEVMKRYLSDPQMRRMARMIAERLWINRFLTWSPAVERNTGPGSRMAPSEWLGCDNERFLFATGVSKPIWLNLFFPWDGWDPRTFSYAFPLMQAQAMVPELPGYLQDLAWRKSLPNELQCAVSQQHQPNYPRLKGVADGDALRPMKYVNYQTATYTLGSSTSSWIVNTSYVGACAFWNNSRAASASLGSPERFCVLYPHYVFNGMSFLDRGELIFDNAPNQPLADPKGGMGGPWMREFIEFGRMGTLQHRNTLLISYTSKPGTHSANLVKSTVKRASAGMFLFRWTGSMDGLYINREPVRSLPAALKPGDWWFIDDGDVYAAVRPLEATRLRGDCKSVLEKRTRHVVLYSDNFAGESIAGISDETWVKARNGFVVEVGDRDEYATFAAFQDKILAASVIADDAEGYSRHVAYKREGRELDMRWDCYTEEYGAREINGAADPWVRYAQSPEFAVSDNGWLSVRDATLATSQGKTIWLLSCTPSRTWVAYQANVEQDVRLDFNCPAGRVFCERFPFGKLVLKENRDGSLHIDVDASYRPFFSGAKRARAFQRQGTLPSEFVVETNAPAVSARINGVPCPAQRELRDGRGVWVVNPYHNPSTVTEAAMPVPLDHP